MNKTSLVVFALAAAALLWGGAAWADIHDPHPQAGDLALPMPDGARMVFRPVHLGRTMEGLSTRMVWVGKGKGGVFYETPTQVEISGAFNLASAGSEDWVYYLGKYEVTQAQFYSLMPVPKNLSRQELLKSTKPMTGVSWFQAQDFLRRYNEWLAANAPETLPLSQGAQGDSGAYLRLPNETEWEFAARGGGLVDPSQYFRLSPYGPNQTIVHEWCFPEVVRNPPRVRKVGLKKPHPLGLYDLLGNVAEMTTSLFRVEYTGGRSGGFALRGGSALKDGAKATLPSKRSEMPLYKNGKAFSRNDVGMRLVITSLVTASRQDVTRLKEVYQRYGQAAQPVFGVSLGGSSAGWQQLREALGRVNPQALKAVAPQLNQLEAGLRQATTRMRKVESDSALVTIRTAVYCLFATYKTMVNEMYLRPIIRLSQSAARRQRAQQNLRDNQEARGESLEQYFAQLDLMDRLYSKDVVLGQLEEHRKLLVNKSAGAQKVKINQLLGQHYQRYLTGKQPDKDGWVRDLQEALFTPGRATGAR
ncbi:MAG: formylglycine-generating enzyme family protein [Desulfarculaceae bacterium]|nr:formylglycine-generating enzyme family protein [Desulfarculaceae bacterium]MCF8049261.1 formylglycine-generating enzyme family protein [Desulfarculaceae bacterium]MCF8065751.1 formylglycine-generating enzyme family protein [Desulfarculaceae bacterium]MCF8099567.1 formylglycine-generating enzyme family protein [Desulfarculaceae bacterium]